MCQAGRKLHRSAKFEIPKILCSALIYQEVWGDSYMEYNFEMTLTCSWFCVRFQKCISVRNPDVSWCLLGVLGDFGDKVGDLLVEAVPVVDVVVAEPEAGREDHEADVLLARLLGLLVQADGQGVRHDGVILC